MSALMKTNNKWCIWTYFTTDTPNRIYVMHVYEYQNNAFIKFQQMFVKNISCVRTVCDFLYIHETEKN